MFCQPLIEEYDLVCVKAKIHRNKPPGFYQLRTNANMKIKFCKSPEKLSWMKEILRFFIFYILIDKSLSS